MGQDASDGRAEPAEPARGPDGAVQGFSPLPTGARIGELVVQSVLGAGAFGITYLTEHEKRSKRYALKEYFPRSIAERNGLQVRPAIAHAESYAWGFARFLSEARALQKIKHPALVSIFGVTEHGGTGYVGMAYEQGRDYGIWLHEQKRIAPQEEIDKILTALLEGLEIAHASNVFHLDLNPDCIVIRENGTPVLVDFGVFRVGLRRRLPSIDVAAQTYAAPELLATKGGPVGPWTDIYSLAGLLYLAVTGKAPLSAAERATGRVLLKAAEAAQGRYRSDFLAAIDAGLHLVPGQRPQSIGDWRKQLQRTASSRFGLSWVAAAASPAAATAAPAKHAEPAQAPAPALPEPSPAAQPRLPPTTEERAEPPADAVPLMENSGFRAIFFGATGLLGGALAGALASVVVASLLRPECAGDNCMAPFVMPLAILGALAGAWEGVRFAGKPRPSGKPPRSNYEI